MNGITISFTLGCLLGFDPSALAAEGWTTPALDQLSDHSVSVDASEHLDGGTFFIIQSGQVLYAVIRGPVPAGAKSERAVIREGLTHTLQSQVPLLLALWIARKPYAAAGMTNDEATLDGLRSTPGVNWSARIGPSLRTIAIPSDDEVVAGGCVAIDKISVEKLELPPAESFAAVYCKGLSHIARQELEKGNPREALVLLKDLQHRQGFSPDTLMDSSECFLALGQPDSAIKILNSVEDDAKPGFGSDRAERLGELYRKLNMPEESAWAYKLALSELGVSSVPDAASLVPSQIDKPTGP